MGFAPQLSWDGTGGTYMLRDAARQPLAAFKPCDEEPFAPNNPRGLSGKMGQQGIHGSIPSGEAHLREAVVYKLDHDHYAAVPLTLQAEAVHPNFHVHSHVALSRYGAKVGSLQAWVHADDVAANLGAATFPTREVHKIALLDMRLLNTDRNDSNILVRKCRSLSTETDSTPASPTPPLLMDSRNDSSGSSDILEKSKRSRDVPCEPGSGLASPMDLSATPRSWMGVMLSPPPLSLPASMESVHSVASSLAHSLEPLPPAVLSRSRSSTSNGLRGSDSPISRGTSPSRTGTGAADLKARPCELVPIDHGGCLPTSPSIVWYNWCWLSWPQMKTPPDEETRRYIQSLNPEADAKVMAEYGIAPSAIRASRCATLLIQRSVAAGLTLHDAAVMLCRPDDDAPSELERLILQAERLVVLALNNPRLRANPDSSGCVGIISPSRKHAVGSGLRPEHAFSAQNLSTLDPEPAASPVRGHVGARWTDDRIFTEGDGSQPRSSTPAPSLQRPAGAAALPRVLVESDFASPATDGLSATSELNSSSPCPPRPRLHRVNSEVAIVSTPASPFLAQQSGHEHSEGNRLDAALEPTFFEYYERMLSEVIRRAARRTGIPEASAPAPIPKAAPGCLSSSARVDELCASGASLRIKASSPNDVISDLQATLLGPVDVPTVGLPCRRRS